MFIPVTLPMNENVKLSEKKSFKAENIQGPNVIVILGKLENLLKKSCEHKKVYLSVQCK